MVGKGRIFASVSRKSILSNDEEGKQLSFFNAFGKDKFRRFRRIRLVSLDNELGPHLPSVTRFA